MFAFMKILVLQRLLIELAIDIVYFPLWWYTAGAKKTLLACGRMIAEANRNFAPWLWFKNIFVPMFGQYDFAGRVTSFIVRAANVFGRTFALCIWICVVFVLFLLWLAFPLFVLTMLFEALF